MSGGRFDHRQYILIDIPVGDGEYCGACPLNEIADICPLFDEVIYDSKWGYKARRCASCLAAEAEYKNRFGWKTISKDDAALIEASRGVLTALEAMVEMVEYGDYRQDVVNNAKFAIGQTKGSQC